MYLKKCIGLDAGETGGSLHDKLARLGAAALMEALPGIADTSLQPQPQDEALATYAKKLSKDEAFVSWNRPATELERMVRAFSPWPVAQTRLGNTVLRLWECALPDGEAGAAPPGCVVREGRAGIDVATGDRLLRITRLQPPGKRPMPAADFLNARSLKGEVLG
jgi:methionyl-tRNA formyltransferase